MALLLTILSGSTKTNWAPRTNTLQGLLDLAAAGFVTMANSGQTAYMEIMLLCTGLDDGGKLWHNHNPLSVSIKSRHQPMLSFLLFVLGLCLDRCSLGKIPEPAPPQMRDSRTSLDTSISMNVNGLESDGAWGMHITLWWDTRW